MPTTLSPLRYPGGKSQLYKFVKNLIRENQINEPIYVEPFAGGAGLAIELLLKNDVHSIVINDFDKAIYKFWKSIIYDTQNFIYLIRNTPVTMEQWNIQKEIYKNQEQYKDIEIGFATFFLNRTNRSGIIKGGPISKDEGAKYPLDCRYNKEDLIDKIISIASLEERIHIYNFDAVHFIRHVLPEYAEDKTFIFFDPPYYKQGKNLYTNFYSHEDHEELCNSIKNVMHSKWITTYDFNENIKQIYANVPAKVYQISYSAHRKRKEKEFLFHNINTIVPAFDKVQFVD